MQSFDVHLNNGEIELDKECRACKSKNFKKASINKSKVYKECNKTAEDDKKVCEICNEPGKKMSKWNKKVCVDCIKHTGRKSDYEALKKIRNEERRMKSNEDAHEIDIESELESSIKELERYLVNFKNNFFEDFGSCDNLGKNKAKIYDVFKKHIIDYK